MTDPATSVVDAPHPRSTSILVGQSNAENAILEALRSRKLAHAWLISGPEGIGKATLAFRFARFVLASPDPFVRAASAASLAIAPDHPTSRRIAAGAHPDLHVLERMPAPTGKLRTVIQVDDARRAVSFLQSTSGEGGWKVLIVDSADDLNGSSANSLLKIIEEPPGRSLALLVANAPARLPATIASRCRRLRLEPLAPSSIMDIISSQSSFTGSKEDVATVVGLARGSVKQALTLARAAAVDLVDMTRAALDPSAGEWRTPAMKLAAMIGARSSESSYDIVFDTIFDWLCERANGDTAIEAKRAAASAALWSKIEARKNEADTYNLDKRALLLTSLKEVAELSP